MTEEFIQSINWHKGDPIIINPLKDDPAIPNNQEGSFCVDLGCGKNKREGFIGEDQAPDGVGDIQIRLDILNDKLPFEDSSVDCLFASHIVEHIGEGKMIAFMDECYMVLKPYGLFEIIAPVYNSSDAYRHPDHKRFIHPELWGFWDPANCQEDRECYGVKAKFTLAINEEERIFGDSEEPMILRKCQPMNFVYKNGNFVTLVAIK